MQRNEESHDLMINLARKIKMKAAVLTAYHKVEWLDVEKPVCKSGEVLIQVTYGCICGSDQHIHKGEFHPRTKTPMIMGHEFGGRGC